MVQNRKHSIELERYEAKYIIHLSEVNAIRDYILPFVVPDPNATKTPPEYTVTTLQLDSEDKALYRAKEVEAQNRFKLRIRTYGTVKSGPVFMEIKRKIKGVIVKSRVQIASDQFTEAICRNPTRMMDFKSKAETINYLNFVRLVKEIGAEPVMLIRYDRESYLGKFDNYARVTFDRRMRYCTMSSWDLWPSKGRWWSMDTPTALNRPHSGVILELKTFSDTPWWMVERVQDKKIT